ncbi:MAG: hypothetical protein PHF86_13840 [Candidatus Nanoarchaeia archaeon]|nr:hypothetical protein [Candidatus Nanoarchaeia archaeon]
MSIFEGIRNWFSTNKYETTINNLEAIDTEIEFLLNGINEDQQNKYKIIKELETSDGLIGQLITRFNKINDIELEKLKNKNPELTQKITAGISNLTILKKKIYNTLKKEKLTEQDKKSILMSLDFSKNILIQLKENITQLFALKRREFDFSKAIIYPKPDYPMKTADGIPISKIIKLANGFGFTVRKGTNHLFEIDFKDRKQPCALAKNTVFGTNPIRSFTQNTYRSKLDIYELLKAM